MEEECFSSGQGICASLCARMQGLRLVGALHPVEEVCVARKFPSDKMPKAKEFAVTGSASFQSVIKYSGWIQRHQPKQVRCGVG